MRDQVYSKAQSHIVDFAFSEEVAEVFPDMIRRSVPGYETVIPMTGLIAARHVKAGDKIIDLGCSLGATSQAIAGQTTKAVSIIGVDNSVPMIEGAIAANTDPRISFFEADTLSEHTLELAQGAQVIVMNFVLQFCEPTSRKSLLQALYAALAPEGLLILSEKIRDPAESKHSYFDETHLAWKRANGYSDLEVSQKRTSLENVMQVDLEQEHLERLTNVGFASTDQWYKCMNWASYLAWKTSRTP
ncbi:MAG: carboxy-S-adenosyl-L-methionine synthase CmoA [Pseudomonadales bacterium]|nr:carboxy-S-adenosyl-L-methionine synthase CmoA [Pseudomonadales bacterium]